MPTLLIRHGYGTRLISEKLIEKVPIARKNNEQHYARFGGFIQGSESLVWSALAGVKKVKINSVYGFSETDGYFDVQYVGHNAVALGYYLSKDDTVSVPLFNGFPLVWCELRIAKNTNNTAHKSNVVDLFPGNSQRGHTGAVSSKQKRPT